MILEKGDMWSAFGKGVFMITTNPIRKRDGSVVMGRGIALESKTRFPGLPYAFGDRLAEGLGHNVDYIGHYSGTPIWYFMVKEHWAENAKLEIIRESVFELKQYIQIGDCEDLRFDLNFPGIGNGKLSREEVLPLLQELPDNVHIWEKDASQL